MNDHIISNSAKLVRYTKSFKFVLRVRIIQFHKLFKEMLFIEISLVSSFTCLWNLCRWIGKYIIIGNALDFMYDPLHGNESEVTNNRYVKHSGKIKNSLRIIFHVYVMLLLCIQNKEVIAKTNTDILAAKYPHQL